MKTQKPACFEFEFEILDENGVVKETVTKRSELADEALAIDDAAQQLGDCRYRYTQRFKKL